MSMRTHHRPNSAAAQPRFTDDQVRDIRRLSREGVKDVAIAQRFSAPTVTVSRITCGKTYKWVTL